MFIFVLILHGPLQHSAALMRCLWFVVSNVTGSCCSRFQNQSSRQRRTCIWPPRHLPRHWCFRSS